MTSSIRDALHLQDCTHSQICAISNSNIYIFHAVELLLPDGFHAWRNVPNVES